VAERTPAGYRITRMTILVGPNATPHPPQRITFEKGQSELRFSGRLDGDAVDVFLVNAKKGQFLEAAIERFPGRALALKMLDAASGRPLNPVAGAFARSVSASLAMAGDSRIEVVRRAAFCDPAVTYQLTIRLR
jgi:hypothetical protein